MTPMDAPTVREHLDRLPAWTPDAACRSLSRSFRFHDFAEAFAFMTQMALVSDKLDHHPEWFNVYNRVDVTLNTHDAGGVTARDIEWATRADLAFARFAPGA